jgi:hypothetical protein
VARAGKNFDFVDEHGKQDAVLGYWSNAMLFGNTGRYLTTTTLHPSALWPDGLSEKQSGEAW